MKCSWLMVQKFNSVISLKSTRCWDLKKIIQVQRKWQAKSKIATVIDHIICMYARLYGHFFQTVHKSILKLQQNTQHKVNHLNTCKHKTQQINDYRFLFYIKYTRIFSNFKVEVLFLLSISPLFFPTSISLAIVGSPF